MEDKEAVLPPHIVQLLPQFVVNLATVSVQRMFKEDPGVVQELDRGLVTNITVTEAKFMAGVNNQTWDKNKEIINK